MSTPPVGPARLVCSRGLGWLGRARSGFALPEGVTATQIPVQALKPVAELGLAMSLVDRETVAGAEDAHTARLLAEFAWDQLERGALLYRRQLHDPASPFPMEVYASFVRAGYRHRPLEALCAHLIGLRSARVRELAPHHQLAVVAAARQLGLPAPVDPLVLAEWTWLGGQPEPWMLDVAAAYALTHTVFHLTDFGADPGGLPQELQQYLHLWLPVWVEVVTETKAWDLLAELLIVDACLTEPQTYPRAWERLAQAQDPDGMLPHGITRAFRDQQKEFRHHYHPTLVAVIAGTVAVSRSVGARA
ncbi:MAG: hypothetical protein QOG46_776 [Pseudonocardiales bacterium]|nr:hypothetical protein [Pseudonocardiales bacterium]